MAKERSQRRSLLSFAAAIALGGCSLAPDYHPPIVETPQAFKEAGIWAPAAPGTIDTKAWWTGYGDPTLDDLEERIATGNPTLAAALSRYEQAQEYLIEAQADIFPHAGIQTGITDNRQSDNRPLRGGGEPDYYQADTVGGQVNYELDLWGRVRNSVAAGKAEAEASADDMAELKLSLESDLASSYLALRGYDQQIELLRASVTAYTKADALTRNRFTGGAASGIDAGRAGAQLGEAEAQLEDAMAARALTEHAIASLVGTPASAFSVASQSVALTLPDVPGTLPSDLLQRRPDIAAAERRVSAANSLIGVTRAAFFPSISLGAQGGVQNTGLPNLFSAPNLFWSVGPSFVLTLLDGGRRQAQLAIVRAKWTEATADYRDLTLKAFQQVEDNLAELHHLGNEAAAEQRAVDQAGRAEGLSLNRYVEGAATYLDVVTAQTTALRVRRTAIDLTTRRLQAHVHLVAALGGGWAPDAQTALAKTGASAGLAANATADGPSFAMAANRQDSAQ